MRFAVVLLAWVACGGCCAASRTNPQTASRSDWSPFGERGADETVAWHTIQFENATHERDPADEVHVCRRLAVAFVVDRSPSMMNGELDMAKAAVHSAVDRLSRNDCLTVVAFDIETTRVIGLRAVTEPASIAGSVDLIHVGEGPANRPLIVMANAIQTAYWELLNARRVQRMQIIVYSNGFAGDRAAWVGDLGEPDSGNRVIVSAMALPGNGEHELLRSLAQRYGGRFYQATDTSTLVEASRIEVAGALSAATRAGE